MKRQFEVLYRKNAWQSTLKLAEPLGIPKSTVHYNLKKMEMVNCYDVWIPHILTENHLLTRVTAWVSLLARHKSCYFWTISSREMRNSLRTMWYEKEACHYQVNPVKLSRRLDFIRRRQCCAFSGIVEDPSIMNFYWWMKLLTRRSTVYNSTFWRPQLKKNALAIYTKLFSIKIMPDCMSQSTRCKNWRALGGIF